MIDAAARFPAAAGALPAALGDPVWPVASLVRNRAGRSIVALGSESTAVYIVLEGRVQVAMFSSAGREVVLRDLSPGALFGELSAIDGHPRSASIVALDDCLLACIPGEQFRDLACATPEAALWLARRLAAQVRELSEKVFELNALRVPTRLHCELLRLCHAVPDGIVDGRIAPFPTHAELAARIGTHREAVTREIGFLAAEKIIEASARRVAQIDVPRLTALVRDAAGELGAARRSWPAG